MRRITNRVGWEARSLITNAKIALSTLIVLAAASTAFAKSSGGLPKLDLEYACHASQKAVAAIFSTTMDVFSACMSDETAARDQLEKDWASIPASNKSRCIQPKEY